MKTGIALGSNLGEREATLLRAFAFLRTLSTDGAILASSLYHTEPVDCPPGSPAFLNAVAEIDTAFSPRELLARLQEYERQLGRAHPTDRPRNAPRHLDLDILYYDDVIQNEPDLMLPHPRAAQRLFVLKPLDEIRPALMLPGQDLTVHQLLQQLPTP